MPSIEEARTRREKFGELYRACYGRILNYIFRCTLSVELAEDITSTVFLKALQALSTCKDSHSFLGWLYRIAGNEVKMHWRSRRNSALVLAKSARICVKASKEDSPELVASRLEEFARLRDRISRLPQKYRIVISLRFFEELDYQEMAHLLGKRVGTVKSLVHRGVQRLRNLSADATPEPDRHLKVREQERGGR